MKLNASMTALVVLALAGIAVGCGSSSNNNSTSTASLTKAQWIAKADAFCQAGTAQTNAAGTQQFGNQKPSQAQIQQFATTTIIPGIQSQVDKIKALGAPVGDEQQVNTLISTVQADLDKAKSDPSLVTQGNAFSDANKLAQQYGLKVCGKG
jgi:hypothetical protein